MAKKNLGFDASQLKQFCDIYHQVPVFDEYGSASGMDWELVFSPRCKRNIKTKTSQSNTIGGSFDFYQVYEFIIRDDPRYTIEKDMEVRSDSGVFVVRGVAPLENNPNYILIITETKK